MANRNARSACQHRYRQTIPRGKSAIPILSTHIRVRPRARTQRAKKRTRACVGADRRRPARVCQIRAPTRPAAARMGSIGFVSLCNWPLGDAYDCHTAGAIGGTAPSAPHCCAAPAAALSLSPASGAGLSRLWALGYGAPCFLEVPIYLPSECASPGGQRPWLVALRVLLTMALVVSAACIVCLWPAACLGVTIMRPGQCACCNLELKGVASTGSGRVTSTLCSWRVSCGCSWAKTGHKRL